jgi:hypothetical protein
LSKEVIQDYAPSPIKQNNIKKSCLFILAVPIIYAGPPLTSFSGCYDFQITDFNGLPQAACLGGGTYTITNSGRLVVFLIMSSNMTCPNQFVTNEVQVFRHASNNGIDGRAVGHCLDNGRLRGRASAYYGCDGFDSTPFPDVSPMPASKILFFGIRHRQVVEGEGVSYVKFQVKTVQPGIGIIVTVSVSILLY